MELHILIATVTSTELASLNQTLESIFHSDLPASFKKLHLVENGPGSTFKVEAFKSQTAIEYLRVARGNKSHALNLVLFRDASDTHYIPDEALLFFTDDDVVISKDCLHHYVLAATKIGRGHYFGGPTQAVFEKAPENWLMPLLPLSATGFNLKPLEDSSPHVIKSGRAPFLGFNWAAFAGDIRTCGGFDPEFGPGSPSGARGQESNMQLRMRNRGMKAVYLPQALVSHQVPYARSNPKWMKKRAIQHGLEIGMQKRLLNHKYLYLLKLFTILVYQTLFFPANVYRYGARSAVDIFIIHSNTALGQLKGVFFDTSRAKSLRG